MEEARDLTKILDWLRRQELNNAHIISVLEGRHTPQFAAFIRVLDGRDLNDLENLKQSFSVYTDSPSLPNIVIAIWDSEMCRHWMSPPRRFIEVTASARADLSALQEPILDSFSDELELCIAANDYRTRRWIRDNCSPIAWYHNVIYTVQGSRYRPKPGPSVRLLTARDEKAVKKFVERAGPDEHRSTIGHFELAKRGLFYRCYGTFDKDRLTGFLTLFERTTNVWEVLWVRVDGECRRQGIGSAVLTKATNDILAAGKIPMYLTTPSNIPALSLISNMGFAFAYERCTAQITEARAIQDI